MENLYFASTLSWQAVEQWNADYQVSSVPNVGLTRSKIPYDNNDIVHIYNIGLSSLIVSDVNMQTNMRGYISDPGNKSTLGRIIYSDICTFVATPLCGYVIKYSRFLLQHGPLQYGIT